MDIPEKRYLGDSVYAEITGVNIKLTTSNGIEDTNIIYLEPEVVLELEKYINDYKKGGH